MHERDKPERLDLVPRRELRGGRALDSPLRLPWTAEVTCAGPGREAGAGAQLPFLALGLEWETTTLRGEAEGS